MASRSSQAANDSDYDDGPFKLPAVYLPCVHAANQLGPILLSQMKSETHHRGKRAVVRVIIRAERNEAAVVAVLEDEELTFASLILMNQPSDVIVPADQTLRFGRWYLIKEPFLQVSANGLRCLRVDHPGDILLLPVDHELIPAKWRKTEGLAGSSRDMRMKGNDAVGKQRWTEAEDIYTTAARIAGTAEEVQLAYLNRSLANLRLGRPAVALSDAIKSYEGGSSAATEKSLFREASALYELAKYDQCLGRLEALQAAYPTNNSALTMINRVKARLQEQQTGQYDFRRMHKQAEATPPLIDCATYKMPVEVRDSPGKQRGVFTKRKVLAGEMLICEKAFGYIPGDLTGSHGHQQASLCAQVVQKLFHNIEDARQFGDLYHGDFKSVSVCEVDGKPVVDACLVGRILALTQYRSPRTSLSLARDMISGNIMALMASENNIGIWPFTSYINHSCIGNVKRSFIGDMQIVRAARDLEAGAELLVSYKPPLPLESYDKVQHGLRFWGFTCDCALCLDRKETPERVLTERKSLSQKFDLLLQGGALNVAKAQKVLDRLGQTYSAAAMQPGALRLELSSPYFALGRALAAMGKPTQAIKMILRGLEAQGFVISASPRGGSEKSSKPELRVTQWGQSYWFPVEAFRALHRVYKTVAPENLTAARAYLELAYAMFVGEKESIRDIYPELYT